MSKSSKESIREYLKWTIALQQSMEMALRNENPSNVWKHSSYKQFARKYMHVLTEISKHIELPPLFDRYDIEKMRGSGGTIAHQQKDVFENVYVNVSLLRSTLESRLGVVEDQITNLIDFLRSRLRSAVFRTPEQERDVQDAIEQLLIGRGLQKGQDYDREAGRVKASGKESIPDFIMPPLSLALEVKLVKTDSRGREVVDEINADIPAYAKGYRRQLFLIYDLGHIRNEIEFRHDIESAGSIDVLIVKH
ncbi:hypothetical protein [Castellaniella sp.]|uniref:PD-(D/E)XK nuclease domain-containing protein n=1 Tax=Castellaniella sp. TaxID=1955812 RepID=UPI002AFEB3C1|nr:hypothetical protein [Castellaniella sp.]